MIGSAGEITGELLDAVKALSLDRVFAQVDWGGLPSGLWGARIVPSAVTWAFRQLARIR